MYSQARAQVTSPIAQAFYDIKIIENLPGVTKADLAEAMPVLKKNLMLLDARMDAELAQIKQMAQAAANPAGATGPSAPGQTPAEGGGTSVEGKPIPPDAGHPVDVRTQNQMG